MQYCNECANRYDWPKDHDHETFGSCWMCSKTSILFDVMIEDLEGPLSNRPMHGGRLFHERGPVHGGGTRGGVRRGAPAWGRNGGYDLVVDECGRPMRITRG